MKKIAISKYQKIDDKLLRDWKKLWEDTDNAHFFNSPEFFKTYTQAFPECEYVIYTATISSKLTAVLFLELRKKYGVKVLASPGCKFLEKSSLLVKNDDQKIVRVLLNYLIQQNNLFLSEVSEKHARVLVGSKVNALISVISLNPYIDLETNPFKNLSKKQKSKVKNKRLKFGKYLKYRYYENNFNDYLDTITEVEARSYKKLKHKDILSDDQSQKYLKSLVKNAKKFVAFDILYYKNNPIVYNLGLKYKNRYLAHHTSYHANFRKLSPGKLLLSFMLPRLKKSNYELFDFSRGHNVLKKEYAPEFVFQYDLYCSKNKLTVLWWKFINFLRRIKARLTKNNLSLDGDFLFKTIEDIKPTKYRLADTKL